MQEKRKNTPWREYIKEIASWYPLNLYKNGWFISRYPNTDRSWLIVSRKEYEEKRNEVNIWIDFSWDFSQDLKFLIKKFPKAPSTIFYWWNENTEFADAVFGAKNAYLTFAVWLWAENVMYSFLTTMNVKNIFGSVYIKWWSENIYNSLSVSNSFNVFFSQHIQNCSNIWESSNLIGCQECIYCDNLINQSYCIENKTYEKDEYFKIKNEKLKDKKSIGKKSNKTQANNYNSTNVSWFGIIKSSNIENWFFLDQISDSRNCIFIYGWEATCKSYYDCLECGNNSNDFYGVNCAWTWSNNIYNSSWIWNSQNIYYSYDLDSCSYCLGCIWLKNKQFCILNKQYTKEERFEKANEIFAQMDKDGTLWSFFPASMNPFYFNDTAAYLIDDTFTKEEVTAEWYLRRDEAIKVDVPTWADMIETKELNDYQWFDESWVWKINPEILKKVIKDEKWNFYRIVPMELEFLQKHGLPLPEIHWLERIKLWFKFK